MMKKICDFISRWMGALVLVLAILALLVPAPFASVGTWVINPMLGLIMFGMGLTLNPKDFRIVFTRPKDVLIGCLAQFTIMPLLAWCLTKAFALPPDLALGVILVGCCPGGTASNVITYLAKGDLALSVGMTATSTVLAPLLTPSLTWLMADTFVDVDAVGMLLSIVYVVIVPIIGGFLIQHFLPHFTKRTIVVLVVILHNLCGLGTGYFLGYLLRLTHAKRSAISVEVGMQNSGLATSLATIHFSAFPMAAIPGAIFSVWHNISGALVAKVYSMNEKSDESV